MAWPIASSNTEYWSVVVAGEHQQKLLSHLADFGWYGSEQGLRCDGGKNLCCGDKKFFSEILLLEMEWGSKKSSKNDIWCKADVNNKKYNFYKNW